MTIPLTVVSGYLGAGKTTLINRVISAAHAKRLCVIVNDFGDLCIDAEILRRSDGLTLPLANGCVCCSAASGLFAAFDTALSITPAPERILLEASGVADPARLAAVAVAEPELEPGGVFTVVDGTAFAADVGDALKGPDVLRQVRAASAVLLSRCDVNGAGVIEHVRELLSVIVPGVPVMRSDRIATLAHLTALPTGAGAVSTIGNGDAHKPEDRYVSCSIRCGVIEDLDGFIAAVRGIRPPPLRLKGLVRVRGASAPVLLNVEHGRAHCEPVALASPPTQSLITAVFRCADGGGQAALESLVRRHSGSEH